MHHGIVTRMTRVVFYGAVLCAVSIQLILFSDPGQIVDMTMWGAQVEWFAAGDPQMFDQRMAYGHPGGPLIEGGLFLHALGIPYKSTMAILMVVLDSLLIAGITTLMFVLRRNVYLAAAVLGILLFEPLYLEASPPSLLATLLATFLTLYTVLLYERRSPQPFLSFLGWGAVAGGLVATRVDIGAAFVGVSAFLLLMRYGLRAVLGAFTSAFVTFWILDPFMWFMPWSHIMGLREKITVHYTGSLVSDHSYLTLFLGYATPALVGLALGIFFVLWRRSAPPVDRTILLSYIGMTLAVSALLFSSQFGAIRYFMPVFFLWEVLLPLFLLHLCHLLPLREHARALLLQRGVPAIVLSIVATHAVVLLYYLLS